MTELTCTQKGCPVGSSGKCLEGFDPIDTCPYVSSSNVDEPGTESPVSPPNFVELPSGEALTETQAADVTREGDTSLVIVAGPVGSGKTTILTSLFESFLEAPTGNYLFAGSKTLVGFERRCHDARKASGRLVAETGHTSRREGVRFLHLKLAAAEADIPSPRHLLLSDVSGELFKTLRDSNSAVKEMTALQRADHLCVVIDGQKLTELGQRQVARNDARSMLRSIIAMGVLSPTCKIEIVFSKWDLILSAQPTQDLHRFLAETRGALAAVVGQTEMLQFYEIAARPTTKTLPFAHGVPTLLRAWMEDAQTAAATTIYYSSSDPDEREFSRFARRVMQTGNRKGDYNVTWV